MLKDQNAENRLIILYLLDKIKIDVTDLHITRVFRSNNLMNYFAMQEQLAELVDNKLVLKSLDDNERIVYKITKKGREILKTLTPLITPGIRFLIEDVISGEKKQIINEYEIDADFTPIDENNFIVTCSSTENSKEVITINLNVPSREDAQIIRDNWKSHSGEIFTEILNTFFKKRD